MLVIVIVNMIFFMWILSILIGIVVFCLNIVYVLKYEICLIKIGSDFFFIYVYEYVYVYIYVSYMFVYLNFVIFFYFLENI